MLRNDSNETFETTKDRAVDDNWPGHNGFVGGSIPQVEALG